MRSSVVVVGNLVPIHLKDSLFDGGKVRLRPVNEHVTAHPAARSPLALGRIPGARPERRGTAVQ